MATLEYLNELFDEFDSSRDARLGDDLGDDPHHLTIHQFTKSEKSNLEFKHSFTAMCCVCEAILLVCSIRTVFSTDVP